MAAHRKHPARAPAQRVTLPSLSKGTRPEFYEDPAIDQLFAIVTALTGELSVAFDRIDALERVLVAARALAPHAVESFVADGEAAELRARAREELLRRVFAVFEAYAKRERPSPSRPSPPRPSPRRSSKARSSLK
jgi:hypothetical protein